MATSDVTAPPQTTGGRLRQVGPGLLVAAAGVGAGDLVATMVAGAEFGTVLLWAAVLGTVLKIGLAEGVGRWTLASGATMLDGWRLLGRWTTVFSASTSSSGASRTAPPRWVRSACRSTRCSAGCPCATGR